MSLIKQIIENTNHELIKIQDEIRNFFGWDLSDDLESTEKLLYKINNSDVNYWKKSNRDKSLTDIIEQMNSTRKKIVIIGAAVSSSEIIKILKNNNFFVLADGAGAVFSTLDDELAEEAWARTLCIISDGDGGDGLIQAIKREIPLILHAHGDNIHSWSKTVDYILSSGTEIKLVLTHQLPKNMNGVYNFGGFTDGDRAVCFVHSAGVPNDRIVLIGTRTDIVGQWSGITDKELKLSKLKWMKKVLQIIEINY
jgi:uncharacterized Rossmann fold enzyme